MHKISLSRTYRSKFESSWRFSVSAYLFMFLVYFLLGWAVILFYPLAIQNLDLFGESVVAVFDLRTSDRSAYHAVLEDERLVFHPVGDQMMDSQTGSVWDVNTGIAMAGPFSGAKLQTPEYPLDKIYPYINIKPFTILPWNLWQRFDTNWYLAIAERGYLGVADGVHFPPFFPLGIRIVRLFTGNTFIAGLLLSNFATILAIKLLYDFFGNLGSIHQIKRSLLYFLVFPTSFFLFGAYTESLYLVAVLLAFRKMQEKNWHWAGFWIFCSVLIRLQGVAMLIPFAYGVWESRASLKWSSALFGGAISVFSVMVYFVLRYLAEASLILPLNESAWHVKIAFPWESIIYSIQTIIDGHTNYIDVINLLTVSLFLFLIIAGWKRIPKIYSLYMLATWVVITSRLVDTQPLVSVVRYALTLFPAFFVMSNKWMYHPVVNRLIIYGSFFLNIFFVAQFWIWGWVA